MPTNGLVTIIVIAVAIGATILLIVAAIKGTQKNLVVTPEQQNIPIRQWYKIKSPERCKRVRSQLPVPTPDEPGADEEYAWVTGLVPSRLVFLLLPSLLAVVVSVVLWRNAQWLFANPYPISFSRNGLSDTINVGRLGAFLCNVGAIGMLLFAIGYAISVSLKWSGEYFALGTYRVYRFFVHPAWAFWMKNSSDNIDLHQITHAGDRRGRIFADAFRYATVTLDTPGEGDDPAFSEVRFIPNGTERSKEIDAVRRALVNEEKAQLVSEQKETNRLLRKIDEGLSGMGGRDSPAHPVSSGNALSETRHLPLTEPSPS